MDHTMFLVRAGRVMADLVFKAENVVDKEAPVTLTREKLRKYLGGAYAMGLEHGASLEDDCSPEPESYVDARKLH